MGNLVAHELREHARRVREVQGGPKADLLKMAKLLEDAAKEVERLDAELNRESSGVGIGGV